MQDKTITLTAEEIEVVMDQLVYRLGCFDKMMEESNDPDRIREIVHYTDTMRTVLDKMIS